MTTQVAENGAIYQKHLIKMMFYCYVLFQDLGHFLRVFENSLYKTGGLLADQNNFVPLLDMVDTNTTILNLKSDENENF